MFFLAWAASVIFFLITFTHTGLGARLLLFSSIVSTLRPLLLNSYTLSFSRFGHLDFFTSCGLFTYCVRIFPAGLYKSISVMCACAFRDQA